MCVGRRYQRPAYTPATPGLSTRAPAESASQLGGGRTAPDAGGEVLFLAQGVVATPLLIVINFKSGLDPAGRYELVPPWTYIVASCSCLSGAVEK